MPSGLLPRKVTVKILGPVKGDIVIEILPRNRSPPTLVPTREGRGRTVICRHGIRYCDFIILHSRPSVLTCVLKLVKTKVGLYFRFCIKNLNTKCRKSTRNEKTHLRFITFLQKFLSVGAEISLITFNVT